MYRNATRSRKAKQFHTIANMLVSVLRSAYFYMLRDTEKKGTVMDNLIKEARQGNTDAFTQLMQSQMKNMYKTAWSILYNDEDVADAISETILTCWEKLWLLKKEAFFRTWMTRILINKCNDILRRQKKLCFAEEIPESPSCDANYENVEWKNALKVIDEKYRVVLVLYYVEGFATKEISEILDMPESTVRSRLERGRKRLAKEFV